MLHCSPTDGWSPAPLDLVDFPDISTQLRDVESQAFRLASWTVVGVRWVGRSIPFPLFLWHKLAADVFAPTKPKTSAEGGRVWRHDYVSYSGRFFFSFCTWEAWLEVRVIYVKHIRLFERDFCWLGFDWFANGSSHTAWHMLVAIAMLR